MRDNSISTLAKIVLFHNGQPSVKPDYTTSILDQLLPLDVDEDEANSINNIVLTQILSKNAVLASHPDQVKALVQRIKDKSDAKPDTLDD